jgi:hypothetical protein
MAIDTPRVNGNLYSWASIEAKINGETVHGFTSINYADKRTRTKGYGQGRHHAPRGRSAGKYEVDPVKVKAPKDTMQALRASLAAQAGDSRSYGNVEFELVVQYVEEGNTPITVELSRCVWSGESATDDEGPDPLMEEAEFDCMQIRRNGLTLFDSSGEG